MENLTEVKVDELPQCDYCHITKTPARYDAKSKSGPWAYMCGTHYNEYGIGLGTGKGQRLVLNES